jgi:hypothetical protein
MKNDQASNLPLNTILETASKLNKLELRISEIYKSTNLILEEIIKQTQEIEMLKENTINQFIEIYKEIDKLKG